jgi:hypothetical protein
MYKASARMTFAILAAGTAAAIAAASPALAAGSAWRVDHHPQPAGLALNGVFTASPQQAWVAGTRLGRGHISTGVTDSTGVIEQWNGSRWTTTPGLPHISAPVTSLNAISGTGVTDVWAVGDTITSAGTSHGLAEHFNGATWTVVASPRMAGTSLGTVSADSPTDAWAGGSNSSGPLAEHWNGTGWRVTKIPSPPDAHTVESIDATSPTNAWALGLGSVPGYSGGAFSFADHWNGSHWSLAFTTATGTVLTGLSGTSASDMWAVGSGLIEHFDGTAWTQVANPAGQNLAAVAALSPGDAWAMSQDGLLVEHWNGSSWAQTATAPYLPAGFSLRSMSGLAGGPLFAVGNTGILEQPDA